MTSFRLPLLALGLFAWSLAHVPAQAAGIDLVDGDRVVLLGNTFVERDQTYGYLETLLITRHADKNITFRNLGWSGDTVWGHSRAGFGSVDDGYKELKARLAETRPTVVVIGYGMNESFEGEAGLANFLKGFERLLKDVAETKARVVVLGPNYHEDLGRPLPDPAAHNAQLKLYSQALERLAREKNLPFVDLFESLGRISRERAKQTPPGKPLTDNGIHLSAAGYQQAALMIAVQLGVSLPDWQIILEAGKSAPASTTSAAVSDLKLTATGGKFQVKDALLPLDFGQPRVLKITGLAEGAYALVVDGKSVAKASAASWASGVPILTGPDFEQTEKIRQLILDKNSLFFYRWRPQNWTYLFGFRKHEQGQNAKEIPEFDPLVAAQEAEIAKLRTTVARTYEIRSAP